ncbi:SGNH/GDSL hydrolase family protein [Streptomyces sp. NPDC046727]|uniref:SGNH/GDSL hydrolase family protein n=1 Tax=Streptomyces sp. NPDC046727 TaxID=3155373 RepID=UPI0033FFE512
MRPSRTAAVAASLLLSAGCAFVDPATAEVAPRTVAAGYVALGDSYSSGAGAGDYLPSAGKNCKRSSRAYPVLWAEAHRPSSFSFLACNGAGTGEVLSEQLGPLGARTRLVSLTVGGTDSGFATVMTSCALGGTPCRSAVSRARTAMDGPLARNLDRLYSVIRNRAPAARVVVLGYPHLYHLRGSCALGLPEVERAAINDAVDHLNEVIAQRAADHGFTFADVTSAFAGHEICSSRPWLHGVDVLAITESYHPTAPGQSFGYLPALDRAS